jgi:DeoR family transcriptional regulator, fructose operon transcriptional repressor
MAAGLIPADRQKAIREMIHHQGIVRVNELSEMFDVSVLTIRRDLDLLEQRGVLERTHGGAILRQNMPVEPLYSQKEQIRKNEKEQIARAAVDLIQDGDMVLVNSGSTTQAVISALAHKKITIITNNIGAARIADAADFGLIFIGGNYRTQSQSVTGDIGLLALGRIYANKAVIGVDGFSLTYGLTTPIMQEAEVTRKMIEATVGTIIVVADSSKIGVVSNFRTADLRRIDYLITDDGAKNILSENELNQAGVEMVIAGSSGNTAT